MKRLLVIAASVVVLAGAVTSGAFAGEVKGNGEYTPIGAAPNNAPHASSICSFSGLNDEYYRDGDRTTSRTQHPGPGDLQGGDNACKGN